MRFLLFICLAAAAMLKCGGLNCKSGQTLYLAKANIASGGKQGAPGPKGEKGDACECNRSVLDKLHQRVDVKNLFENLSTSCDQILRNRIENISMKNGIYYLRDDNNVSFPAYCDMKIDGGGWTLVATIHENNIGSSGRCSTGDKWSSEHGNQNGSKVGAEAWFNYVTFGNVISATSEDYKNSAYFDIQAKDVMIWQVPNDTPLQKLDTAAYLKFRTSNGFLGKYNGSLFNLYKNYFPIISGVYKTLTDNGPNISVTFDKGSAEELKKQYGNYTQSKTDAGYIEFRAVNKEQSAYALCPGLRARPESGHIVEHFCIGSTADNDEINYCGDFASFSWDDKGPGNGGNVHLTLLQTTFAIFYR